MSAYPFAPKPVRVLAWGVSTAQAENAVRQVSLRPASEAWDLAEVERVTEGACPIDVGDPHAIVANCGSGWAYAVYPAGSDDA
jgi:hypothetical protein